MDVTSRELREGNIRDALRGYNHDDVDELLERAAVTVDGLSARVNELTDRLSKVEGQASRGRETEEQLSRALLVAQRTADEIVEEARGNAKKIIDSAAADAAARASEAERAAKAELEDDQRRLKAQVLELAATREQLDRDVASLTEFAEDLGGRIRTVLESQLAALDNSRVDPGERPRLSAVDLPIPDEGVVSRRDPDESERAAVREVDDDVDAGPPTAQIDVVETEEQAEPEIVDVHEPAEELVAQAEYVPEPVESVEAPPAPPAPPSPSTGGQSPLLDERFGLGPARPIESRGKGFDSGEVLEGEVLDDDTFFASLRDAVSDDAPLGPRDEALGSPEAHGTIFEESDEDESRGLFRRRR